jgi:hypothetical protein
VDPTSGLTDLALRLVDPVVGLVDLALGLANLVAGLVDPASGLADLVAGLLATWARWGAQKWVHRWASALFIF